MIKPSCLITYVNIAACSLANWLKNDKIPFVSPIPFKNDGERTLIHDFPSGRQKALPHLSDNA